MSRVEAFLGGRRPSVTADVLDALLAERTADARAAWVGVEVTDEAYCSWLGARAAGDDPVAAVAQLHTRDLYLTCALAAGDGAAVVAFERELMAQMPSLLPPAVAADEVCQRLRHRLLIGEEGAPPRIGEYAGRGPLHKWLRVAALRIASNLRRYEAVRAHDSLHDAPALDGVDPELALIKARYGDAFARAFRAAFAMLTTDERNIFRLHFVDGLNIERIGALHGVHRSTVARWIAAGRQRLFDTTLAQLQAELRLSGRELESMIALVRSQADVSLRSLLADAQPGGS